MSWDAIRGHDDVRRQLLAAFTRGRLAHAYLFVGPDGVGKRRFAAEFAKALLCDSPPGPLEPCDRCPACVQVAAGTHPDFFAVGVDPDAAQLSVDAIRGFCHRLGLKPSRGGRKVGLVEDADAFNVSSANAFLKPLEEPPPNSVLVLLGTSADRQLPTIVSRCQVLTFRPLGPADLDAVLTARGVADPAKRDRLAKLSGGSPGRALALADDAVWGFREALVSALTADRPDPAGLAEKWVAFAEAAGKEKADQRERAGLGVHLVVDVLRHGLRAAVGGASSDDRLARWAARVGPDAVADRLDDCLEAEKRLALNIQVAVVIEALVDRLFRRPPGGRGA